jgi:hypothetical protein
MANTETPVVEEPTSAESAAPTTPSLSINDLIVATKLIQIGAERNVFNEEELPDVVILNNKLIAFLTSVGAIGGPPEIAGTEEK